MNHYNQNLLDSQYSISQRIAPPSDYGSRAPAALKYRKNKTLFERSEFVLFRYWALAGRRIVSGLTFCFFCVKTKEED